MVCGILFWAVIGTCSASNHRHGSGPFHWAYGGNDGPLVWPDYYHLCAGKSQSPIDLPAPGSHNPAPEYFTLGEGWFAGDYNLEISNNGHTAQVNLPGGFEVSGGGLPPEADYIAVQFHFHWGDNPSTGSEHTALNQHSPLEMHVVMWDKALGSIDKAKRIKSGLAVLGFLFKLGPENEVFEPIVEALKTLKRPDSQSTVDGFNLLALVAPAMRRGFYRYSGSLTTPTCNESVVWTNFMRPITISGKQLSLFTKIRNKNGPIVNNFRPVQPLNGRIIKQYGTA